MNQMSIYKTGGKTIVLICLLLLMQTPVGWAADDITGDWEITMEFGGRQSFTTLSISRNANGTFAGKWGSDDLSDVKFDGEKLTFVRTVRFGDREFSMDYEGTLKDGKITGTMSSDRGEFPANGARKKPKLPVLGQWDISFNVGDRKITGRLAVSKKPDGTLEGKWISERGEHEISNLKFQNGKLTFSRKSTFGERTWESDFEGIVKGHKLTGAFKSDRGEMPATGKRFGTALIGKWELTITSDWGTRTGMMRIEPDLTGRYEFFGGEIPMEDLKLDGDQVTFYIEFGPLDQPFKMEFKGKLDGKTLKGQMESDRGTSEITGKKLELISPLIGTWEFTRETPQGTRTSTLKIKEDMTGTYTIRDNEIAVTDLKVDGEQVSFKVTMTFGQREVPMEFKGKLDGTTLKGEFITQRGAREATGKKID